MENTTDLFSSALEESDRLCKKQRLCASQSCDAIDRIIRGLQKASIASGDSDTALQANLDALKVSLMQQDLPGKVAKAVKEFHASVSKLGKALDKAFIPDITSAYRDVPMDGDVLNRVIAEHLFHDGNFEVGDCFLREAHITDSKAIREPYIAMHAILEQIRLGNLSPALQWVAEHSEQLKVANGEAAASLFEFKIHRLRFLDILGKEGRMAALGYARGNFRGLSSSNLDGIQRLMGCLCYVNRHTTSNPSPYSDLEASHLWEEVGRDFTRNCCGLLGQASESPLLVASAAGSVALPNLLKLAGLLKDHAHELVSGDQLPVEIDLSQEFAFRSVFSCPVSREQSSMTNPPWLLPCGHVLCKDSIMKIAKTNNRPFKCPYCPLDATPAACKELHFPPVYQ